jgi:peptidoglycan-associated lipoprotein
LSSEEIHVIRTYLSLIGLMATLAFGVVGCAPEIRPEASGAAVPARLSGSTSVGRAPAESFAARPWDNPASPLYNKIIYFEYDSTEIQPEYVPLLQIHANYLATHPEIHVTLEGNTDERGAREYNLALGDQRAQTVERFLLAEGVKSDQLATLSFGEEKPAVPGHGEGAWSQNRRVELAY